MWILWESIKKEFPIFLEYPDLVYLDNASTTHKPQSVIDAMSSYQMTSYANIHRWVYDLAEQSELLYTESKKKVAQLIWADFREIIYTYNATYASNILAQSLIKTYHIGSWDTVLLWIRDHHATIVPWQLLSKQYGFQIKFIDIDKESLDIDRSWLSELISIYKPKVVCCSHVSNVTWWIYDMSRIKSLLLSYSSESFFVVDGSQAVPHMKINVATLWCDAYFFTGHKMLWPTGIWVLWIEKSYSRKLETIFGGGGIIESVTVDGCSLIRTADKFEPWTPNLIGAIGLWSACDFYFDNNIYKYIWEYEKILYWNITQWLFKNNQISVLWSSSSLSSCGIVSLVVQDPLWFSEYLASHNICVRAWWHCAHPLLHHLGQDKWVVRISPFFYNTITDIEFLIQIIDDYKPY